VFLDFERPITRSRCAMEFHLTANACRAFREAERLTPDSKSPEIQSVHLLAALASDEEGAAGEHLKRCDVTRELIQSVWPDAFHVSKAEPESFRRPTSSFSRHTCFHEDADWASIPWEESVERDFKHLLKPLAAQVDSRLVATEHILYCMSLSGSDVGVWLRGRGLNPKDVLARIRLLYGGEDPSELDDGSSDQEQPLEIPLDSTASESLAEGSPSIAPDRGVLRILDASGNRAREGLRVLDDYVRFILDDDRLTAKFKTLRHDLTEALGVLPMSERLEARDTRGDVGTSLSAPLEYRRNDPESVISANFHRLQEALRSLEEFGKLMSPEMSVRIERIRYETYSLHKDLAPQLIGSTSVTKCDMSERKRDRLARLEASRLYLLLDGRKDEATFSDTAQRVIDAGVDIVQLRDKRLSDRELLGRARILKEMIAKSSGDPLFIMNDRPDLALLCDADGVHVGQDELGVSDVRELLGPDFLIGVSTHTIGEATHAEGACAADYIGAGPTFPSSTKSFGKFAGLAFLREVASTIEIPAFAIGGIEESNLAEVLETGVKRIAVGGAVLNAEDPAGAVRRLVKILQEF
jgi:thiamine-phosphate pyrophosphorylase